MEQNKDNTYSNLIISLKLFLKETFDISKDTDRKATIEDIKSGINMKGQNAWVLIFSILIASTGLNTSSTAVVIGAMLISPLMGPILGIGLALGIYDTDLLRKSLKNFGVMVILSLVTSFLFFSVPLFQNETQELIARTSPNVLDIIIALSGGFALIVALSRRNKPINTIAGVAIATALMPPLCTAGYGLATAKWDFFGGAMFLFIINTIFIASATYIVVKFLSFPPKVYTDASRRKKISQVLSFIALAIIIPSIYFFYKLYKKSDFDQKTTAILLQLKEDEGIGIFNINPNYKENSISFVVLGKSLDDGDINTIQKKIQKIGFDDVKIEVLQDSEDKQTLSRLNELENSYLSNQQLLYKKEEQILLKEKEILDLKNKLGEGIFVNFLDVSNEIKSLNSNVKRVSFYTVLSTNFSTIDTIPNFIIEFKENVNQEEATIEISKFKKWLQLKLKNDKVVVREQ